MTLTRTPEADYHADKAAPEPSLSSTTARLLLNRSPLHAWTASPRLNPAWQPENKRTFDIGRAAHALITSEGAAIQIIDADNYRSKDAQQQRDAAYDAGLTPLLPHEADAVERMASTVCNRLADLGMTMEPNRSELSGLVEIDGVWCRARFDYAPTSAPWIADFKTTTNAAPDAMIRSVEEYSYDVQVAHYLDVFHAITGERRAMRFVFVEKTPPHEVSVVQLHDAEGDSADWMQDAREKAAEARALWRRCLDADEWPGYPARIGVIGSRPFYRARWADRPALPETPSAAAIRAAREAQAPEGWTQ